MRSLYVLEPDTSAKISYARSYFTYEKNGKPQQEQKEIKKDYETGERQCRMVVIECQKVRKPQQNSRSIYQN